MKPAPVSRRSQRSRRRSDIEQASLGYQGVGMIVPFPAFVSRRADRDVYPSIPGLPSPMAQTIVTLPERPRILALAHTLTAWAAALAFLLGLVAAGGAATVASAASIQPPVRQTDQTVPLQPDVPASPTPAAQANDQD